MSPRLPQLRQLRSWREGFLVEICLVLPDLINPHSVQLEAAAEASGTWSLPQAAEVQLPGPQRGRWDKCAIPTYNVLAPWHLSGDNVFISCHDEVMDFKGFPVSGPEVFFRFDAQAVPSLAIGPLVGFPPLARLESLAFLGTPEVPGWAEATREPGRRCPGAASWGMKI